jgi:hypothetical protein
MKETIEEKSGFIGAGITTGVPDGISVVVRVVVRVAGLPSTEMKKAWFMKFEASRYWLSGENSMDLIAPLPKDLFQATDPFCSKSQIRPPSDPMAMYCPSGEIAADQIFPWML